MIGMVCLQSVIGSLTRRDVASWIGALPEKIIVSISDPKFLVESEISVKFSLHLTIPSYH